MIKSYVYAASGVILAIILSVSHYAAYNAGKQSVISHLRSDRIEILKDGKRIDEGILAADDLTLVCLLTDCPD